MKMNIKIHFLFPLSIITSVACAPRSFVFRVARRIRFSSCEPLAKSSDKYSLTKSQPAADLSASLISLLRFSFNIGVYFFQGTLDYFKVSLTESSRSRLNLLREVRVETELYFVPFKFEGYLRFFLQLFSDKISVA